MVSSFYYSFFLMLLIFLFFFLLILQIFFWKFQSLKVFGQVFTIYKFASVSLLIILNTFFVSMSEFSFNLLMEMNLWFGWGPYMTLDFFSGIFFAFGLLVSWSIMQFSLDYMMDESLMGNFLFFLLIFLLLMFLLVFSSNFLILFVSWESVSLLSFMLISWWGGRYDASSGSLQAVYYNRVGDAGLLMFLSVSLVFGNGIWIMNSFILNTFFVLFLLSVISKSSQLFFHPWLPNAMEGPTPVSSLLHSSTMVMASVYLLMRSLDYFNYGWLVFYFSMFTCILGSFLSMNHMDFKKVVAYSTTSQLSFMMMILSVGWNWLCLLYMMIHAFFKAMIFMMSGVVIHMSSSIQDFRNMFSSLNLNKLMFFFYFLSSMVMMSFPFFSSFWMKDLILEGMMGSYFGFLSWCFFFISVLLTSLYSMRLYLGLFMLDSSIQNKMMLLNSLVSFFPFFRLAMGSLFLGVVIFMFFGPYTHFLMIKFDKFFALLILVLSIIGSFVISKSMVSFNYLLSSYLLFFNPLWHKLFSYLSYKFSFLVKLFDFLFMEFIFFGGVKYVWYNSLVVRFFLIIMILMLFFFF